LICELGKYFTTETKAKAMCNADLALINVCQ